MASEVFLKLFKRRVRLGWIYGESAQKLTQVALGFDAPRGVANGGVTELVEVSLSLNTVCLRVEL
ncbi:hypothetical protein AEQ27_01340 [Frigoribacterium sp. RIT-PI-h]|nr:hypothetical protein AEQ27_01340 [Frigoribacterium sp. RIT-PI-h]